MKKKALAIILGTVVMCGSVTAVTLGGTALYQHASHAAKTSADISGPDLDSGFSTLDTVELLAENDSGSAAFSYSNVADVAEAVMPSIVAITNTSVQKINSFFYRQPMEYEATSAGSGIIVGTNETELLICTNNHVVEDASELAVTFIDEESYEAYEKGSDPENDLAVVAVNLDDISESTMQQLKIAKIGDSETMRVGEQVVAIGNALGYGQSVTTGIISAKNRTITASADSYGSEAASYENLIQTDAAINFGNSGGALLNMNGEVIGINSAKATASSAEGMGYSIPISRAMPILEDLMTRETRKKLSEEESGYLGINGQSVSREATLLYGIPQGIYVTYIDPGSPAEQAGMEEGDLLLSFDGQEITGMSDLQYIMQYYAPGETVDLGLCTADSDYYSEKTITVTLAAKNELQ